MLKTTRVFFNTCLCAFADYRSIYSWKTWAFGWMLRLIMQVSFFGLIGILLGDQTKTEFLVVGNAVFIGALEACTVIVSVSEERQSGRLPLMVSAPASHVVVYLSRGVHFLAAGVVTSTIALCVTPIIFDLKYTVLDSIEAIPLIFITCFACYSYGSLVAAFVLNRPTITWTALNISYLLLLILCGVSIPLGWYWFIPEWLVHLLPLTNGLLGIRIVLETGWSFEVIWLGLCEFIVGCLWLTGAGVLYTVVARIGARKGNLDPV